MASDGSWFRGPPLDTISFDLPIPSKWKVIEKMNEKAGGLAVSWACIKYRCQKSDDKTQIAHIRIWMQIPNFGTEIDDQATRAQQAAPTWMPLELIAYKVLTDNQSDVTPRLIGWRKEQQDASGLVPCGFLVSLAWEEVPGTHLGDQLGSDAFWNLDEDERNRVRDAFKVTLLKIERMGYKPLFASTRNLVWDPTSNTLFVVGFREWGYVDPTPWMEWKFALFGLVKMPSISNLSEWDGDTSGWVF